MRSGITTTFGYNEADQLTGESWSGGTLNTWSVNPVYDTKLRRNQLRVNSKRNNRVRSYSMNVHFGPTRTGIGGDAFWLYFKPSDLGQPQPSQLVLFMEEHEDSIGGSAFVQMSALEQNYLTALPSARHSGANPVSFADGHVEMHKWLDERTRKPVERKQFYFLSAPATPTSPGSRSACPRGGPCQASPTELAPLVPQHRYKVVEATATRVAQSGIAIGEKRCSPLPA